jgi:DNA-binding protein YbaB
MFQKLKQYKDLRDSAKDAQNVLSQETVHADAAGGKINIIIDGNQKIVSLDIDTSLLAPENKEKVEKGVKDAIESANKKLQRVMLKKIQSGELKMPDLPGVIGQ